MLTKLLTNVNKYNLVVKCYLICFFFNYIASQFQIAQKKKHRKLTGRDNSLNQTNGGAQGCIFRDGEGVVGFLEKGRGLVTLQDVHGDVSRMNGSHASSILSRDRQLHAATAQQGK